VAGRGDDGSRRDVHALDHQQFLEEVHSFEFWFHSVEGYLSGLVWGHRPETPDPPLPEAARESLITVLCNYCVGESAALEGASGLVAIAPNRLAKIFLATQVADEGRHLEVFHHRLRDLGVADVDAEVERLRPLVELGGYIPCPDHRLAPDSKWDNVRYYCDRMRQVFG